MIYLHSEFFIFTKTNSLNSYHFLLKLKKILQIIYLKIFIQFFKNAPEILPKVLLTRYFFLKMFKHVIALPS